MTILSPDHPHANAKGYVAEHKLFVEKIIGKILPPSAVIHHVNENRRDNRPENLVVCPDQSYHIGIHNRMRRIAALRDAGGDPKTQILCFSCKTPKSFEDFHRSKSSSSGRDGICKPCAKSRAAEKYLRRKAS